MRSQLVPIVIRPVGFGRVGPDDRLLEPRLIERRLAQPHLVLPRAAAEDHAYTRRRLAVEALDAETDLPLGRLGIPRDLQAAPADPSERSDERPAGNACVRASRQRWSSWHSTKTQTII